MANEEKMTENAVSKAMKPSLATLNRIESGIAKLGAAAAGGAEARVEEARAKKKSDDREEKANTLLEAMVKGISNLSKSMASKAAAGAVKGIGISLATVTAPIVMMASFFKQLSAEFKFIKSLTGGGLKKLFAPLKKILKGEGWIGKAIKGALKFIDKMHGGIFTKIGNFFKSFKNNKTIVKISKTITKVQESFAKGIKWIKKIIEPVGKFFRSIIKTGRGLISTSKTAAKIFRWAKGFGKLLGKLFLPITIVMSAFDFITGFMEGYKEDGIMKGLEEGTSKLLQGLIGMPLDLLKDGVSWILEKFGFEQASETLDAFSFSDLIDKMVGGFFDTVDGVVGWLGDTFKFGSISEALTSMLKAIWMPAILFDKWIITPVVEWLGDIFGFDSTAYKEFSIFDHIQTMLDDIGKWFGKIFDIDIGGIIRSMAGKLGKPGAWLLGKIGLGPDVEKQNEKEALKKEIAEIKEDVGKDSWHETKGERKKDREKLAAKQAELEKMESAEVNKKMALIAKKIKKIDRIMGSNPLKQGKIDKLNALIDADSDSGAITSQLSKKQNKVLGRKSAVAKAVATVPQSAGIDWGFISKKEGGSKIDGYVPNPEGSKSGVTIATGFDLGARNAKDLQKLGLPLSLKEKLAPYLGLQGMVAKKYLDQYPLVITPAEAKYIDKASKSDALVRLKKEWNANAKIMKTPMFESLTGAQKTVAASVAFQYGSLKKAPKFRAAAQEGRWDDVEDELKNFGDDYSSRRMSEAKYLMAARQNNSGGVLNNLHASNANAGQGGGGGSINVNKTNNNSSSSTVVAEAPNARKKLPLGQS